MKIAIRDGKFRLSLRLPLRFVLWALGKAGEDETLSRFLRENRGEMRRIIREARRTHGRLELVHVESADGEEVIITL